MKKTKLRPYHTLLTKTNTKPIKDLNLKTKTMKLLEDIEIKFLYGLGNDFF